VVKKVYFIDHFKTRQQIFVKRCFIMKELKKLTKSSVALSGSSAGFPAACGAVVAAGDHVFLIKEISFMSGRPPASL
jgi:hypothetical protein